LQPLKAEGALAKLTQVFEAYPQPVKQAHLNILDTHDTPRFLTVANGDVTALHLAILMQMTLPGAPSIYYGTEIGLEGGRDPDCRRAFPWEPSKWRQETLKWTKDAIELRKSQPVLRHGRFEPVYGEENALAYLLADAETAILVVFNAGRDQAALELPVPADLPVGSQPIDVWRPRDQGKMPQWGGEVVKLTSGEMVRKLRLELSPRSARVIKL
jgi:neopullulanase